MEKEHELAYAEVDEILNLLEEEYLEKVPQEVRNFFKEERDNDYKPIINVDIPLTEQNLKRETMVLLAILNLNYWCDSEEEKQEFMNELEKNEEEKKKIEEKYNPENLFKKENKEYNSGNENKEELKIIVYKEKNIILKILSRIINMFKRK